MHVNQPSKLSLLRLWALLLLLLGAACAWSQNTEGLVPVPPLSGRVVDLSATLSAEQLRALEQRLEEFEARKGSQIAVLLVPGTQPEAIEQFAIRVAEQWQLGRKKIDDGAILVIAKNERAMRIEVGYGLEGALNDATSKRIIDDIIVPYFKQGDFYGGINSGVDAMLRVIDGEPLPAPASRGANNPEGAAGMLPLLFFAAVIVGGILRSLFGRFAGALATGGVLGLAAWLLLGVAAATIAALLGFVLTLVGGRMGSGWQGGGTNGGGRGGNWGGGGFQGGGGGFGGGGASGRW